MGYIELFNAYANERKTPQPELRRIQSEIRDMGFDPGSLDGIWGPRTQRSLHNALSAMWGDICDQNGWVYTREAEGNHVSRKRTERVTGLIVHWPGSVETAQSLGALCLRRQNRRQQWLDTPADQRGSRPGVASTHVGIDEKEVRWYAAPHFVTFHAGKDNGDTIGVDICSPPLVQDEQNAKDRGIWVGRVPGDPRFLNLHAALAIRTKKVRDIIESLFGRLTSEDHATVDPSRKIDCRVWEPVLVRTGVID